MIVTPARARTFLTFRVAASFALPFRAFVLARLCITQLATDVDADHIAFFLYSETRA